MRRTRINKEDLAWLAAFVDSEGYIGKTERKTNRSITPSFRMSLDNQNFEMMKKAQKIFSIILKRDIPIWNYNKKMFRIAIENKKEMEKILSKLLEFLIRHKEKATKFLEELQKLEKTGKIKFYRHWTKNEINYLKANYFLLETKKLSQELNRNNRSIWSKAYYLKLGGRKL